MTSMASRNDSKLPSSIERRKMDPMSPSVSSKVSGGRSIRLHSPITFLESRKKVLKEILSDIDTVKKQIQSSELKCHQLNDIGSAKRQGLEKELDELRFVLREAKIFDGLWKSDEMCNCKHCYDIKDNRGIWRSIWKLIKKVISLSDEESYVRFDLFQEENRLALWQSLGLLRSRRNFYEKNPAVIPILHGIYPFVPDFVANWTNYDNTSSSGEDLRVNCRRTVEFFQIRDNEVSYFKQQIKKLEYRDMTMDQCIDSCQKALCEVRLDRLSEEKALNHMIEMSDEMQGICAERDTLRRTLYSHLRSIENKRKALSSVSSDLINKDVSEENNDIIELKSLHAEAYQRANESICHYLDDRAHLDYLLGELKTMYDSIEEESMDCCKLSNEITRYSKMIAICKADVYDIIGSEGKKVFESPSSLKALSQPSHSKLTPQKA